MYKTWLVKKLQCSAPRNVGDAQENVPFWHRLHYEQSFQHRIELFLNKGS